MINRKKILFFLLGFFVLLGAFSNEAEASSVRMKVVVVNPSNTKSHVKEIKTYLPKEVTQKDILDDGGLEINYDEEQELLFAYKTVELAPSETKSFEIVIDDVWLIATEKMDSIRSRAEVVVGYLEGTGFHEQANLIAKTIYGRLDDITRTQNDQTATRQQHIGYYRNNLKIMESIKEDMERLEKILVTAGGPPNLDIIEESDANLKSPSSKTTWIIIFIILIFIAILGGAFYFTWQSQAKIAENIFTKEKESTFSEFKNPISDNNKTT